MNEKAKARAGYLYDGNFDPELLRERRAAAALCRRYNSLTPDELEGTGSGILKKLLGRVGRECVITPPFYCDYGYNIEVGDFFYANYMCVILDVREVVFGDHVFIGPNCGFYGASHALDAEKRNRGLEVAFPITVGDDVWIGGNVTVLGGVEIGSNAIVGAGSVVTKNIPSGVIAAGNPCRVVREITAADADRYPMYHE